MADYNIEFRNKIKKKFPSELSLLAEIFQELLQEGTNFIISLLWKMSFDPNNQLYNNCFETVLANLPAKTPEETILLRNELRHQYNLICPGFLSVQVSETANPCLEKLVKSSDEIIAYVVCSHCKDFSCETESEVKRCIYLLRSTEDNNIFGGIRSLRFWPAEANFLKPYASKIADLLEAIYKERKDDSLNSVSHVEQNIPPEGTKTEQNQCVAEIQAEGGLIMETITSSLTPQSVLDNKDIFISFRLKGLYCREPYRNNKSIEFLLIIRTYIIQLFG